MLPPIQKLSVATPPKPEDAQTKAVSRGAKLPTVEVSKALASAPSAALNLRQGLLQHLEEDRFTTQLATQLTVTDPSGASGSSSSEPLYKVEQEDNDQLEAREEFIQGIIAACYKESQATTPTAPLTNAQKTCIQRIRTLSNELQTLVGKILQNDSAAIAYLKLLHLDRAGFLHKLERGEYVILEELRERHIQTHWTHKLKTQTVRDFLTAVLQVKPNAIETAYLRILEDGDCAAIADLYELFTIQDTRIGVRVLELIDKLHSTDITPDLLQKREQLFLTNYIESSKPFLPKAWFGWGQEQLDKARPIQEEAVAMLAQYYFQNATWSNQDKKSSSTQRALAILAQQSKSQVTAINQYSRSIATLHSCLENGGVCMDSVHISILENAAKGFTLAKAQLAWMYLLGKLQLPPLSTITLQHELLFLASRSYTHTLELLSHWRQIPNIAHSHATEGALDALKEAADLCLPWAQTALAAVYLDGSLIGKPNPEKAAEILTSAVQQNFSPAWTMMGKLHAQGLGVAKDPDAAKACFLQAAMQGDMSAHYELGNLWDNKSNGLAARFYMVAARRGYAPAQEKIALMYEQGRGFLASPNKALQWAEKALDASYVSALPIIIRLSSSQNPSVAIDANLYLGHLYETGRPGLIPIHLANSQQCFLTAARAGSTKAVAKLHELRKEIAADQWTELYNFYEKQLNSEEPEKQSASIRCLHQLHALGDNHATEILKKFIQKTQVQMGLVIVRIEAFAKQNDINRSAVASLFQLAGQYAKSGSLASVSLHGYQNPAVAKDLVEILCAGVEARQKDRLKEWKHYMKVSSDQFFGDWAILDTQQNKENWLANLLAHPDELIQKIIDKSKIEKTVQALTS